MRGTRNSIFEAIHVVSAWSNKQGITLAALESVGKSNEIKTIPKLLDIIDIKNATITTDAMGCQRAIAQKIMDKKGDYVLQVKGNQKCLNTEIQAFYHKARREGFIGIEHDFFEEVTKGHGRIEQRIYHHVALTDWMESTQQWEGAKTIIRAERKRIINEKESTEVSWYLSSLDVDAKHAGHAVRGHWGVENNLHWRLDVIFREDECRMNSGAMSMAVIKRFCMNLLTTKDNTKRGMKHRVMAAAIDDDYREKVLMSV
ncbi:hypothetical protein TYM08_P1707 [Marinicellulosiphila megalodicopiae]